MHGRILSRRTVACFLAATLGAPALAAPKKEPKAPAPAPAAKAEPKAEAKPAAQPKLGNGEVKGLAEFRKGEILIVGGQRVRIVEKTKIKGVRAGEPVPLGYEIKAKGAWRPDGSLEAKQLEAKPNVRDPKEEQLVTKCDEIEALYKQAGRALRMTREGSVIPLGALHDDGPRHRRARRILDRMLPPYLKKEDVRLYVVDNADWNAFAMANFALYVHSGLLDDMDDDEVAIVLGHELAHATLEHTRRNMRKSRWASLAAGVATVGGIALSVATGDDALGSLGADAVATVGGLGASALSNGFSRGFEDEADRVGLRYAYEGGFKADKAPALWRKFGEKYKDASGVKTFLFGSHSQSKDRAKNLEGEVARNYAAGIDKPSKR